MTIVTYIGENNANLPPSAVEFWNDAGDKVGKW